jgi:lipid A 3-O-deacylase
MRPKHFFHPVVLLLVLPALSASLHAAGTPADPASDSLKFGSVSIYTENDKYFAGSDKYYTNGFKLSALSAPLSNFTAASVPAPARWLARNLSALVPAGHDAKLGLSLGQNIYTPVDIHTPTPNPADRPYAAWLYVGAAFQSYDLAAGTLDTFEVQAGMVGPAALGEQIQNGFHDLIGVAHAEGWAKQIGNEPGVVLSYERKWRWQTVDARAGWGADFIPHAGLTVGNVFTYANAGLEVRAGWNLPADFGANLIRPSGDSNSARAGYSLFLFGAVDGRAVARDITLDGNSFRDSRHVERERFVGDFQAGVGFGGKYWQLTYCQAVRSKEFAGQPKPANFGSISVTFFY